ncbi:MAG: hypothetical protein LBM92_06420 [Opitutaceae bacterium]|nr:hypothetical protein [Opitutaceae bacterium]
MNVIWHENPREKCVSRAVEKTQVFGNEPGDFGPAQATGAEAFVEPCLHVAKAFALPFGFPRGQWHAGRKFFHGEFLLETGQDVLGKRIRQAVSDKICAAGHFQVRKTIGLKRCAMKFPAMDSVYIFRRFRGGVRHIKKQRAGGASAKAKIYIRSQCAADCQICFSNAMAGGAVGEALFFGGAPCRLGGIGADLAVCGTSGNHAFQGNRARRGFFPVFCLLRRCFSWR